MRIAKSALAVLLGSVAIVGYLATSSSSVPGPIGRQTQRAQQATAVAHTQAPVLAVVGAAPGDQARATVRTAPGARCGIEYTTPRGTSSTARGLVERTANADGVVAWSWTIGTSTVPGTGDVAVTCDSIRVNRSIRIG